MCQVGHLVKLSTICVHSMQFLFPIPRYKVDANSILIRSKNRANSRFSTASKKIMLNSSEKFAENSGDNADRTGLTNNIVLSLFQTPSAGGRCIVFWEQYGGHQWGGRNLDSAGNKQHFRFIQTSQ